jgi:hypothetical protein
MSLEMYHCKKAAFSCNNIGHEDFVPRLLAARAVLIKTRNKINHSACLGGIACLP